MIVIKRPTRTRPCATTPNHAVPLRRVIVVWAKAALLNSTSGRKTPKIGHAFLTLSASK